MTGGGLLQASYGAAIVEAVLFSKDFWQSTSSSMDMLIQEDNWWWHLPWQIASFYVIFMTVSPPVEEYDTPTSVVDSDSKGTITITALDNELAVAAQISSRKYRRPKPSQPLWALIANSIVIAARDDQIPPEPFPNCYLSHIYENIIGLYITDPTFDETNLAVKVNKVHWRQTIAKKHETLERIEITLHGLTGGTIYELEIFDSVLDKTVGKFKVCTKVMVDQGAVVERPISPITTLLDTLTQLQVKLTDIKQTIKKSRKEHTKKVSSMKVELEQIKSKLGNNDKNDERVKRKLLSLKSIVKQLETEIEALEERGRMLEKQISETNYETIKKEREELIEAVEKKTKTEQELRESYDSKLEALRSEVHGLNAKKDRLSTKKQKFLSDLEKLESELTTLIEAEIKRRNQAREEKLKRRNNLFNEFSSAINQMETTIKKMQNIH